MPNRPLTQEEEAQFQHAAVLLAAVLDAEREKVRISLELEDLIEDWERAKAALPTGE